MIKYIYWLRREIGSFLRIKGTRISKSQWRTFFATLKPIKTEYDLRRIGAENDGGYLVPNILDKIEICISPGVSDIFEFEKELLDKYQIRSILIDGSVDHPIGLPSEMTFIKKFLGTQNDESSIDLNYLLKKYTTKKESSVLLQMDIEGFELPILRSISRNALNIFGIMVIEFHELHNWKNKTFFNQIINPLFSELSNLFYIVHLHPNNCDGLFRNAFFGKKFPMSLEVTFVNKKLIKMPGAVAGIPHKLDKPNSLALPDISVVFD